jgi:hypothetical protein
MDPASAGVAANYQMDSVTKKHLKKSTSTSLKPVAFSSAYDASTNTVKLTFKGKPNFAKGGQITVTATSSGGVASAAGVLLATSDTKFTISPNAKSITGPA